MSRPCSPACAGLGLERLIAAKPSRRRALVVAMIVARILAPRSKLATARGLCDDTLSHSLAGELGLGAVDEDALYAAMDWLLERQGSIERRLARRHLADGALVLYDVSSTWMEGRCCPLARHGYARDGKRGKAQIVFGLLCNAEGCPVAVEVFAGDTADPATLGAQIDKLRTRFGLTRVVLVGDRGLLTSARIREEVEPAGLDWISALARAGDPATGFGRDAATLAVRPARPGRESNHPDFPGERLIACRNPLLAERRARKREALLRATERDLGTVLAATRRQTRPLKGRDKIGLRIGRVIARHKMAKHIDLEIADDGLHLPPQPAAHRRRGRARRHLRHPHQPARDGPRRPRHSARLQEPEPGRARLPQLQDRRSQGPPRLSLPPRAGARPRLPVHARLSCRVAHAPHARAPAVRRRGPARCRGRAPLGRGPGHPFARGPSARRPTKRTLQGAPVHSFQTLLDDLATIAKNRIQPKLTGAAPFEVITRPTALQRQALDLLGLRL